MTTLSRRRQHSVIITAFSFAILAVFTVTALGAQRTIEYIYLAGIEASEQATAAITAAFEAENPDIRVDRIRVQANYRDRVVALIAAGTVPDVLNIDMNDIMSFGDERFLHDLTPLVQKTPGFQVQRLAPPILDTYMVDGKLFAAPNLANPSVYVFNTDLFDQAGLGYPTELYRKDAWTWSAFRDIAKKLTRKESDGRFAVKGASIHLPRTWLFANGGSEFDDTKRPTKTFYDGELGLQTVQFLQSMMWEDDAAAIYGSLASQIGANDVKGFAQGKVGMASRWFSSVPDFCQVASNVGLVPYPKGPGPQGRYTTDLGMFGMAISKQTRDLDAAWRFVSYLAGPSGAAFAAKQPGRTPPRPILVTWLPQSVINPEIYPDLLVAGTSRVVSINRLDLQRVIDSELAAVWRNTVEPKTAVSEIARLIGAFLKDNPQ